MRVLIKRKRFCEKLNRKQKESETLESILSKAEREKKNWYKEKKIGGDKK